MCRHWGALPYTQRVVDNSRDCMICFEGVWGVGLASRKCDLNRLPLGDNEESWVLRSDGGICHNGKVVHQLNVMPDEGDIIVSY